MADLVVATTNLGKFEEIRSFLREKNPRIVLRSLRDFPGMPLIVEDGSTFLENARKKAKVVATFAKIPALADDSGLEVDALGGRPGVFSARFAGQGATDVANNQKLIEKLKDIPPADRTGKFKCAMVIYAPSGHTVSAMGELAGVLVEQGRGTNGFGYDPHFFVPELGRTLAEMTTSEKNRVSHRAKALTKISSLLEAFLPGK